MRPVAQGLSQPTFGAPDFRANAAHATGSPPPTTGAVASLARIFEANGEQRQQGQPPAGTPPPPDSKRQRLASIGRPPLPSEWTASPELAHGPGAGGTSTSSGATPVERQLWEEGGGGDAAAREARLEKIRAKFGTKRFYAARELPPAELCTLLGCREADLSPDDCQLRRWEALPVVLSGTSNGFCLNWVLKGQSGCVALASSAAFLFVLGAGQTIFLEESDGVQAFREEGGVAVRLGAEGCEGRLSLKVTDAELAADLVATINGRAARRAALRRAAGGGAGGAGAAAAPESAGAQAPPAAADS